MNEMIERAARAAYTRTQGSVSDERWREIWEWHTDPYTTSRGGPWYLLQCVTATIEVMREPTEAMIAALDVDEHRYGKDVWRKMSAAALE